MRLKLRMSKAVGALSAMATSPQFDLLRLPNEIIALIIEQVDDRRTLRRLARTCHRIQDLAENKLYRTLTIRSGDGVRKTRGNMFPLLLLLARVFLVRGLAVRLVYCLRHC